MTFQKFSMFVAAPLVGVAYTVGTAPFPDSVGMRFFLVAWMGAWTIRDAIVEGRAAGLSLRHGHLRLTLTLMALLTAVSLPMTVLYPIVGLHDPAATWVGAVLLALGFNLSLSIGHQVMCAKTSV